MKKYNKIFCILIISMFMFSPDTYQAEENSKEQKEVDISISPSPVLFHLTNVKPGDKISREITISNKGKQDFRYLFSNTFLKGSEKFYNELILEISDGKAILAEGKVKDFKKLDLRALESSSSETLQISIEIPYELGNEFQGLSTEFQFNFLVEGSNGAVTPVDNGGGILPDTGTDYYKFLLMGMVLFISGFSLYMVTGRKFASKKIKLPQFPLKERKEA
ncbi:TasA family protein [Mangrovibacillus sp. Mu-81]|uniref:TasA family protein n=1 Tax=Mangrovibacillus sp. Mu-81 TaxID=3121478 RepID=UPI002FE4E47A